MQTMTAAPTCVKCRSKRANRPRCMCWTCYYKTGEQRRLTRRLNPAKVRQILMDSGTYSVAELARQYQVSTNCIYLILRGEMYREITEQVEAELDAMTDAELDAMIAERYPTMPYTPEDEDQ